MSDDQYIAQAPVAVALPSPPADVTEAATTLRVACARWAPTAGTNSYYKTEVQACDVALGRDGQFAEGALAGIMGTLAAVWFVNACRHCVRAKASCRAEKALLYTYIVCLGAAAGIIVGSAVIWRFGHDWSGESAQLVFGACGLVATGLMAALRGSKQSRAAA